LKGIVAVKCFRQQAIPLSLRVFKSQLSSYFPSTVLYCSNRSFQTIISNHRTLLNTQQSTDTSKQPDLHHQTQYQKSDSFITIFSEGNSSRPSITEEILSKEKKIEELQAKGNDREVLQLKDELWRDYVKNLELIPAERVLKEVTDLKKDLYGPLSTEVANCYSELSEICFNKMHLDEALDYRNQAIEIRKNLNAISTETLIDYVCSGEIKKTMRMVEESKKDLEHALKIFQTHKHLTKAEAYAKCLYLLSTIYQDESNYIQAYEYSSKALSNISTISMQLKSKLMLNIANSCVYLGRVDDAERYYYDAIDIMKRTPNFPQDTLGETLYSLSVLYASVGNPAVAESFALEALKLIENSKEKYYLVSKCYSTLATSVRTNNPTKALEYFRKALTIEETYPIQNHCDIAFALNSIGKIEEQLGNSHTAFEHFERALESIKRTGKNEHLHGDILMSIGLFHSKNKNYEKAEEFFKGSFEKFSECYPNEWTIDNGIIANHRGINFFNLKNWAYAIGYLCQARDTFMAKSAEMDRLPSIFECIDVSVENWFQEEKKKAEEIGDVKRRNEVLQATEYEYRRIIKLNYVKSGLLSHKSRIDEYNKMDEELGHME